MSVIQKDTTEPGRHKGYGKVILFGEHFVVYKHPAVVCAVKEFTDCFVEATPGVSGWTVIDNRPAVEGYIVSKAGEQADAHDKVIEHLKLDLSKTGIKITLGGSLVPTSGIGASASNVTSLARALSESFGLNLSEEEVNLAAYTGEKGYHGTPSGIDNTAATYGGLLSFQRTDGAPKFEKIEVPCTGYLVVVSTGITASTTEVVGDVRRMREEDSAWFAEREAQYLDIYNEGLKALAAGDLAAVGRLMNANHELCKELKLSIPELEAIVLRARELGALGAKLSGTGRGGIAIALCDSVDTQKKIATGLQEVPSAKYIWEYTI